MEKFGALFIEFGVDGDPAMARGYFKTAEGQVIDSFEVVAATPSPDSDNDGFTDSVESETPLCGNGVSNDTFEDSVADDGCPGGPAQVGAFSEYQF